MGFALKVSGLRSWGSQALVLTDFNPKPLDPKPPSFTTLWTQQKGAKMGKGASQDDKRGGGERRRGGDKAH